MKKKNLSLTLSIENCRDIIESVNTMWRLFSQAINIEAAGASNLVEQFLEEKDKIHVFVSRIAKQEHSDTQT